MLEFKMHHFEISPRHYLLLPKLNPEQSAVLEGHLRSRGFLVSHGPSISAEKGGLKLHVSPSGYAWSNSDPVDAIVPAIPAILGVGKRVLPLPEMKGLYFRAERIGGAEVFRLSTRVESSLWRELRGSGESGLTPDESAVASFLIAHSYGCSLITDFPAPEGRSKMIGRRQYYLSELSPNEASTTLRDFISKGKRNSYLPQNGLLNIRWSLRPNSKEFANLFRGLGDWCGFIVS